MGHIQKDYEAKDERMSLYLMKVWDTLKQLNGRAIKKIPRAENIKVDALARIVVSLPIREAILLLIHLLTTPSIAKSPVCSTSEESQEWTSAIKKYLRTRSLPEESKHAHRIRVQAACFTLIEDCLYKQSFGGPYLRCLDRSKVQYVLAELHEGVCGNHSGSQSLAHRAHAQGYYWPTMKQDAEAYVKKCDKCQRYAPILHMPSETLNLITSP